MGSECPLCSHMHEEDGSCFCGCDAEETVEEYCDLCGCPDHSGRQCQCGCEG